MTLLKMLWCSKRTFSSLKITYLGLLLLSPAFAVFLVFFPFRNISF